MQSLMEFCLSKKGAVKAYPFGPEPMVIKVGGRMFALITEGGISVKCDPVIAANLREQYEAVKPGYHLNKQHWNTIAIDGSIPEEELKDMISHSYDLVFKGLTKVERNRISVSKQSSTINS
ncbi:MmcQ/YjbR family DNA-binding protein [Paenibacillus oenotherae]|uniref:MmcQ/YjbR family DNA-binding protein n=1 Tax=Paenibacillus oenotherae TaxID=1435645 RepID=A0ABS7D496_9BACL|nr:MmcQ/YjbR family DNA-binding protein [Paenibacillus oenotherae]MBW7474676.1 MmcQ/YjbR family DNA-binding protein [Paenibacillus oenotherae]